MTAVHSNRTGAWTAGKDWKRLADHVYAGRVALGMKTRKQLADAAGFSDRLLGSVERGERGNYDDRTKARLERALGWAPGSVDVILAGGDPIEPAVDNADDEFAVLKLTVQEIMARTDLPEQVKLRVVAEAMDVQDRQVQAKRRFERQQAAEREQAVSRWRRWAGDGPPVPRQGFHADWHQPELT